MMQPNNDTKEEQYLLLHAVRDINTLLDKLYLLISQISSLIIVTGFSNF